MEIRQATINAMDRLAANLRWCTAGPDRHVRQIKSIIADQEQGTVIGTATCLHCNTTICGQAEIGGGKAKVDQCEEAVREKA
jgi:hypothetical protein